MKFEPAYLLNMGAQPHYSLLSGSEDELLHYIKTTSIFEMRFFHKGIWLDVILILAISSSLIAITSIHSFDDLWWCTSPKTVRYTNVAAWFILSRFIVATEKFFPDQPAVRSGSFLSRCCSRSSLSLAEGSLGLTANARFDHSRFSSQPPLEISDSTSHHFLF